MERGQSDINDRGRMFVLPPRAYHVTPTTGRLNHGSEHETNEPMWVGTMTPNENGRAMRCLAESEQFSTRSYARCAGCLTERQRGGGDASTWRGRLSLDAVQWGRHPRSWHVRRHRSGLETRHGREADRVTDLLTSRMASPRINSARWGNHWEPTRETPDEHHMRNQSWP